MPRRFSILPGRKFGRLIVLREADPNPTGAGKKRPRRFEMLCECGKTKAVLLASLMTGQTQSCGCLHKEKHRTHGAFRTPEYRTYHDMKNRCLNPNTCGYRHYGALGVCICARWLHGDGARSGLECFLADMGPRPTPEHSIDRIDPAGNYEPSNCRWATKLEQMRNMRRTVKVLYQGETVTLAEVCDKENVQYHIVKTRLRNGWTLAEALSCPVGRKRGFAA